jgi:LruC domain-containing protein
MMASGAGNKLSVYQRLPNTVNITYESKVYNGSGALQASASVLKDKTQATSIDVYTPTVTDLEDGLRILGNTTTTMSGSWNARATDVTYVNGYFAKTKIVFTTPVARSVIGLAPYDLYIRVENGTKLDTDTAYANAGGGRPGCKATTTAGGFNTWEIHPVGFCKKADGSEVYKDAANFPYVVIVPGLWKWPLEGKDIRNAANTGYPRFANWMATNGASDADWYNEPSAATSSSVYYKFVTGNKTVETEVIILSINEIFL